MDEVTAPSGATVKLHILTGLRKMEVATLRREDLYERRIAVRQGVADGP
jgi:integrase